jgi:hypothetical protein
LAPHVLPSLDVADHRTGLQQGRSLKDEVRREFD